MSYSGHHGYIVDIAVLIGKHPGTWGADATCFTRLIARYGKNAGASWLFWLMRL